MRLDRAEILRAAHAAARRRIAPHHSQRYGDTWREEDRAWVPKFGYRIALAGALRAAWRDAKSIALSEEIEAELALTPIPADVAHRTSLMRLNAWYEPITTAGTARMREIHAEADEIEQAARSNIIPAMDRFHHAAC